MHRSKYRFRCTGCGLAVDTGYPTREEAIEAWEHINAPKFRSIEGFVVPQGYTLVPSHKIKQIVDFLRMHNFDLFKLLMPYCNWHPDVPMDPPPIAIDGNSAI
jgi:hypothetical protein